MQFIRTTNLPATATKPSRIKATTSCGNTSLIISRCDPELDGLDYEDEHAFVAIELCKKLGWTGTLVNGGFIGGYVFCFTHSMKYEIKA